MSIQTAGATLLLCGSLIGGTASAQEPGQLPSTVRAFHAERFQRGTDTGSVSAFEAFDWENESVEIHSVASMFPTEFNRSSRNRGSPAVEGINLPPINMQNRGNRAVMIGIVDYTGNVCRKIKIMPGGAENLQLCGNVVKWHDTKQMVTAKIVSGSTYEVYWGTDRWLIRDVSLDKQ